MAYYCDLSNGTRLYLDNQGDQTIVILLQQQAGQQQQSSQCFATGPWQSLPQIFVDAGGTTVRLMTAIGDVNLAIQGMAVQIGLPVGAAAVPIGLTAIDSMPIGMTMPPMAPMGTMPPMQMTPMQMAPMQMNPMNPLSMQMGNMAMSIGHPPVTPPPTIAPAPPTSPANPPATPATPKFCSQCGTAVKPTDRFCASCGASLG